MAAPAGSSTPSQDVSWNLTSELAENRRRSGWVWQGKVAPGGQGSRLGRAKRTRSSLNDPTHPDTYPPVKMRPLAGLRRLEELDEIKRLKRRAHVQAWPEGPQAVDEGI